MNALGSKLKDPVTIKLGYRKLGAADSFASLLSQCQGFSSEGCSACDDLSLMKSSIGSWCAS